MFANITHALVVRMQQRRIEAHRVLVDAVLDAGEAFVVLADGLPCEPERPRLRCVVCGAECDIVESIAHDTDCIITIAARLRRMVR